MAQLYLRRLWLSSLFFAAALPAQTIWTVPLWDGRQYTWVRLGPTLTVTNGKLEAVCSAAPAPKRVYGVVLKLTGGNYPLAPGATNPAVWRNGIRQAPGIDYNLVAGVLAPLGPWGADDLVLVDYDAAP